MCKTIKLSTVPSYPKVISAIKLLPVFVKIMLAFTPAEKMRRYRAKMPKMSAKFISVKTKDAGRQALKKL